MIPIKSLPDLPWTEQSAKEIARSPNLVKESDFAWQVDDLFIAGWTYREFTSPPWFWFALTTEFERKHIRRLTELRPMIPSGSLTLVQKGWQVGDRFAKFYGFKPTGEEATEFGDEYLVYGRG